MSSFTPVGVEHHYSGSVSHPLGRSASDLHKGDGGSSPVAAKLQGNVPIVQKLLSPAPANASSDGVGGGRTAWKVRKGQPGPTVNFPNGKLGSLPTSHLRNEALTGSSCSPVISKSWRDACPVMRNAPIPLPDQHPCSPVMPIQRASRLHSTWSGGA